MSLENPINPTGRCTSPRGGEWGGGSSEKPTEDGGDPSVKEKRRATDYCCCNEVQASPRTFVVAKDVPPPPLSEPPLEPELHLNIEKMWIQFSGTGAEGQ